MTWKLPVVWCALPFALFIHVATWWYFFQWLGWDASEPLRVSSLFFGMVTTALTAGFVAGTGLWKTPEGKR